MSERVTIAGGATATLAKVPRRTIVTAAGRGRLTVGMVSAALSAGASLDIAAEAATITAEPGGDLELIVVSWSG